MEAVVDSMDDGSIVVGRDEDRSLEEGGYSESDRSLGFYLCFCRNGFGDLFCVFQGEARRWPQ